MVKEDEREKRELKITSCGKRERERERIAHRVNHLEALLGLNVRFTVRICECILLQAVPFTPVN